MTFLIGDGVVPSNDGRGYVLRRLLRGAVRHAWQVRREGSDDLIFPHLVEATIGAMGRAYPDLTARRHLIVEAVAREDERFLRTLRSGHELLETELVGLESGGALSGSVAFRLHDTYGFPIELTSEIAAERGGGVDLGGFEEEMEDQRSRGRLAWRGGDDQAGAEIYRELADSSGPTEFTGYEDLPPLCGH